MESYLGERSLEQSPDEVNEQQTQRRHRLRWDSVPQLPNTLAHSAIVHFVSFVEGTISKVDIDVLNQMEELEDLTTLAPARKKLVVTAKAKSTRPRDQS